jgi:signal transduction histidine kinase/tetratricopeptide (TPR) repeat protein
MVHHANPYHPVKTGYSSKKKKSWKKGISPKRPIAFICRMLIKVLFYCMGKFFLAIVFICCISSSGIAQTPMIDSLRKELVKQKADSIKVHDRIRISWYLFQVPDSAAAWKYIYEGDSIADRSKNPVLKGIVYEHMGYLHSKVFSKKAITFYLQAENLLQHFPNSMAAKKSMASLALNIGIEHMNATDMEGALASYFEGIKRYEAFDSNNKNLPILYASIISTYYNLGKYETALSYCERSYAKTMRMGNAASIMSSCINYGRVLLKLNQPEKANRYFFQGKAMADSLNDPYYQSKYYQVLGNFSYDEKKYDEALAYFSKALPIIKLTNAPFDIASCYLWMGICNAYTNNFKAGRAYLDSAYAIARESDYTHIRKDFYLNRYLLEKEAGNFAASINYLDSFNVINDSLMLVAQADRIEFADAKYQAEKKEAQIGQLESEKEIQRLNIQRKNVLNYLLIAAAIALLLLAILLYRNFRQKQKDQQQRIHELETQQQLTATEAVLKGEEQERTRLAKDLHDGLGGMLSGIKYSLNTMKGNLIMTPENNQAFERSIDMLDSSIKEMRRVAHNMMPEALVKFGLDTALKDFCNDVNRSGALQVSYQSIGLENAAIEQTAAITIYRIVQELINNTMKHAMAKTAIVQITKAGDHLSVTVEDDGKGFDTAILKAAQGIGWSNIENRVEFLKGTLDVRSEKEKGTSVHIELKV